MKEKGEGKGGGGEVYWPGRHNLQETAGETACPVKLAGHSSGIHLSHFSEACLAQIILFSGHTHLRRTCSLPNLQPGSPFSQPSPTGYGGHGMGMTQPILCAQLNASCYKFCERRVKLIALVISQPQRLTRSVAHDS